MIYSSFYFVDIDFYMWQTLLLICPLHFNLKLSFVTEKFLIEVAQM